MGLRTVGARLTSFGLQFIELVNFGIFFHFMFGNVFKNHIYQLTKGRETEIYPMKAAQLKKTSDSEQRCVKSNNHFQTQTAPLGKFDTHYGKSRYLR